MKLLSIRMCEHDSNFTYYNGSDIQYYKTERSYQIKRHHLHPDNWEDEVYKVFGVKESDLDDIVVVYDDWKYHDQAEDVFPAIENYKKFPTNKPVIRLNHHYAHALSYWPLDIKTPDVSIIIDGFGDWDKSWSVIRDDKLLFEGSEKHNGSLGSMMCVYADYFGIKAGHPEELAGKLMGFQSYGNINIDFKNWLLKFELEDLRKIFNSHVEYNQQYPDDTEPLNWFATVHDAMGDILVKYFEKYCKTNETIFYSGGVAQNVIWNSKLKKRFPNLQVAPHSNDEGLSLGGIEYLRRKHNLPKFKLENFPFRQLDQAPDDVPTTETINLTARALAEGKIVAWYQGNGEIGPRALGNRSILFNPTLLNGKDIINKVKNREYYRPFGASVLAEFKDEIFDELPDNPYMLYVGNVKSNNLESITHVDRTCRAQTVKEGIFYNLLQEFYNITECPVLLNTSLNIAGKPIAGYKQNAIDLYNDSDIDMLVIGNTIYKK